MVHHPQGDFGDSGWKLAQLDAVELIHVDLAHFGHIERQLLVPAKDFQEFDFEKPELTVGNNQEVSAATCRIEESERGELLVEGLDCLAASTVPAAGEAFQLVPQVVQEERLDHLEDALLGGVVSTL